MTSSELPLGAQERWLRPSAFDGAWMLLMHQRAYPHLAQPDSVRLLRSTYFGCGFDFEAGSEILNTVQHPASQVSQPGFFRNLFFQVMYSGRPAALVLLTRGREAFSSSLGMDASECFRRCEALDHTPNEEVVEWLDALAALARQEINEQMTASGRVAERLTLQFEAQRLARLGLERVPTWVALDDNAAGYDVSSWNLKDGQVERRLIEVKSCGASRPEFILTRNEVRVARREPEHYLLHVWRPSHAQLLELPWADIDPFVPVDTSRGQWSDVVIRWPQW